MRLQYISGCGKSTIKVRLESYRYRSNTVKVQSSTVKVQYCTETFFWRLLYVRVSSIAKSERDSEG